MQSNTRIFILSMVLSLFLIIYGFGCSGKQGVNKTTSPTSPLKTGNLQKNQNPGSENNNSTSSGNENVNQPEGESGLDPPPEEEPEQPPPGEPGLDPPSEEGAVPPPGSDNPVNPENQEKEIQVQFRPNPDFENFTYHHNDTDHALLVMIPAGKFKMGASPEDKNAKSDESPLHEVYLDTYYITIYEVSNSQFKNFVDKTGYYTTAEKLGAKPIWNNNSIHARMDGPVTYLSHEDALSYCKWVNGRLPTEAEWEKAARGTKDARIYPWGNEFKKNYFNSEMLDYSLWKSVRPRNCSHRTLCISGRFAESRSPYLVEDMIGNAWEWTADWYSPDYYKVSPYKNPKGPEKGEEKVLKGGGMSSNPINYRISERKHDLPRSFERDYSFRYVMDVETVKKMQKGK